MPQEQQSPKYEQLPNGPISDYIEAMLEQLKPADLEADKKGRIARDAFIGVTLRMQGKVEGLETLRFISRSVGKKKTDGSPSGWQAALTRSGGLRRAVIALESDSDAKNDLANLEARVGTIHGITMQSFDQISSYLGITTEQEDTLDPAEKMIPWKTIIQTELYKFVTIEGRMAAWTPKANELLGSDVADVRHAQEEWLGASKIAEKAGIDVELLARSAEAIKMRYKITQDLGHSAVDFEMRRYDELFKNN